MHQKRARIIVFYVILALFLIGLSSVTFAEASGFVVFIQKVFKVFSSKTPLEKGEGIIGASLIELGKVKEESEDLFTLGDDETLSALALRASHESPLVSGRICFCKDAGSRPL